MLYEILGFKKFKSKAGKDCCVLQLVRDFTPSEVASGSIGRGIEEVFLPIELSHLAIPENVGSLCELYFNRNGFLFDIKITG